MKKRNIFAMVCMAAVLTLTACGNKAETESDENIRISETETENDSVTKRPELKEGQMYSYLTGEVVDESIGTQRPFAIMINNIDECLPQKGISQAEIIYECLVEANITRLMAEFQDIEDLTEVGSIRSARHYYMTLAQDDEAIFTHFGQSPFAQEYIDNGYPTISGLSGYSGDVFYRTTDREAPHNVFSNKEGLLKGLEHTGLTRTYSKDYEGRLNFYNEDTVPENGEAALKVTMPFSYAEPWFEYNTEEGLYYRYQYGEPHMDALNNEQLKFKNLVIVYADRSVISEQDHQDYALIGSGDGLLFTNGKVQKITWKRASEEDHTTYYFEDGTPAYLNCGKSYISVVPTETPVIYE